MRRRANAAGKSETLERYATDYPAGPHDQPQSMCPAFGSLRVGLRMRRTATILSGSACCVYGLTFTSHFYGARAHRRLRAVQLGDAGHRQAVRGHPRRGLQAGRPRRTTTPSSSSISACRPPPACRCDLLPKEIDGVRIIGIDVPGFGVPTHAEAKDVLAGAMLRYARQRGRAGPGAGARAPDARERPTVTLLGEMFPADPVGIGAMLEPLGLAAGPVVPTREWRELYAALDCAAVAAIHPFYTASHPRVRGGRPTDRRLRARSGVDGTAAWLEAIGDACGVAARQDRRRQEPRACPPIRAALAAKPDQRPHHALGLRRLGTAGRAPAGRERRRRAAMSAPPARAPRWSRGRPRMAGGAGASHVQYRASLEQDLAALQEFEPDLAIGTTPVVQKAKELAIPALYFTNLISARPLMGAGRRRLAGAGRQRRDRQQGRFDEMRDFFGEPSPC